MDTNLLRLTRAAALALAIYMCALPSVTGQGVAGQDQDKSNKTDKAKDKDDPRKHFAIISGTVYGPDDRALYGVKVEVHPAGSSSKHSKWERISDHDGEFAVRVPPGPGDYVVEGQADYAPIENGKIQKDRKKHLQAAVNIHIDFEERQDIGLHLK
jgi:hypothetical protein